MKDHQIICWSEDVLHFLLCSTDVFIYPSASGLHCLNYYSLITTFGRANPPTIFFRSILIILGPLFFYINVRVRLTDSTK